MQRLNKKTLAFDYEDFNSRVYDLVKDLDKKNGIYIQWSGMTYCDEYIGIESNRTDTVEVIILVPTRNRKRTKIDKITRVYKRENLGGFSARVEQSQSHETLTQKDLTQKELSILNKVKKAIQQVKQSKI